MKHARVFLSALTLFSLCARADEGMWTFDNIPVKLIQQKYGFTPTKAWLDHVRLSSVRLNDGGSGSFVSPDGLLLTNHHVARGQLQKNSTAEHDYIKNGFYAAKQADELKSPDLEINVLESFEDVTARVQASAKGTKNDADALKAKRVEIAKIEGEGKSEGHSAQVVALYNGGEYWDYHYKVYTDVRIVFAPEQQTAFFGGDPDNFTYPRYDLDMALFRVYENGKPIHTDNYLKWNSKGAAEHELTFVSGHPGSTERDDTLDQIVLERDVINPTVLALLNSRVATLKAYAATGPEQARQTATMIFGLDNSRKVYEGRIVALADKNVIATKEADEADFRARIKANPEWQKKYGSAWEEIAKVDEKQGVLIKQQIYHNPDSSLASLANALVFYSQESKKPDAERLNGYHDAQLDTLKTRIGSPAPVYPDMEIARMTGAFTLAQSKLPADDPWLKIVLAGRTPADAAAYYIHGTRMADPAFRKQIFEGGQTAVDASTDPLIVLARQLNPISRDITKRMDSEVSAPSTAAEAKIGEARFAVYGKDHYPDATFTLRLSYGAVEGYPMNGTIAPPKTTMFGLYDRSDSFGGRVPFDLPQRWIDGRTKLDLSTPMDFVTTNDIIGGNSGSPVINKNAEIVGLVFDGNIESLAGDFVYDGTKNRTVAVHTGAMIEALRKLYGADALADEIQNINRAQPPIRSKTRQTTKRGQ